STTSSMTGSEYQMISHRRSRNCCAAGARHTGENFRMMFRDPSKSLVKEGVEPYRNLTSTSLIGHSPRLFYSQQKLTKGTAAPNSDYSGAPTIGHDREIIVRPYVVGDDGRSDFARAADFAQGGRRDARVPGRRRDCATGCGGRASGGEEFRSVGHQRSACRNRQGRERRHSAWLGRIPAAAGARRGAGDGASPI